MSLNRVAAIAFAAVLSGVFVTPAQSASQHADIAVTGSVGRMCVMVAPRVDVGASTNLGTVSGSAVRIAELSDEQMTTRATNFTARLSAMCNVSHQLIISSDRGGLWRSPTGATIPGFANGVPYRAKVTWNGAQSTLTANAAGESPVQQTLNADAPGSGDIDVEFHIDQAATNAGSGAPLVAGSYTDTIRVTMGPQ